MYMSVKCFYIFFIFLNSAINLWAIKMKSYKPIGEHFISKDKIIHSADDVTKAEVLFSHFVAEHKLPAAVADHFTELIKEMCPDSKIAKVSNFLFYMYNIYNKTNKKWIISI